MRSIVFFISVALCNFSYCTNSESLAVISKDPFEERSYSEARKFFAVSESINESSDDIQKKVEAQIVIEVLKGVVSLFYKETPEQLLSVKASLFFIVQDDLFNTCDKFKTSAILKLKDNTSAFLSELIKDIKPRMYSRCFHGDSSTQVFDVKATRSELLTFAESVNNTSTYEFRSEVDDWIRLLKKVNEETDKDLQEYYVYGGWSDLLVTN